jgi:hypothetical protein
MRGDAASPYDGHDDRKVHVTGEPPERTGKRGPGELPATPTGLLRMATGLAVLGIAAFASVVATVLGVTRVNPIGVGFLVLVAAVTLYMAVLFGALGRSSRLARQLAGEPVLALCVGREAGPILSSRGRVVVAGESRVFEIRARLFRNPKVIRSVPYDQILRCEAVSDQLEIRTVETTFGFAGAVPSQAGQLIEVISSRLPRGS